MKKIITSMFLLFVCGAYAQSTSKGVPSVANVLKILEIVTSSQWHMPADAIVEKLGMKFLRYSRDNFEDFNEYLYECQYNAGFERVYNDDGSFLIKYNATSPEAMVLSISADTSSGACLYFFNKADAEKYWEKIMEHGVYEDEYGSQFLTVKSPGKGVHKVDGVKIDKLKPITMLRKPSDLEAVEGVYIIELPLDF